MRLELEVSREQACVPESLGRRSNDNPEVEWRTGPQRRSLGDYPGIASMPRNAAPRRSGCDASSAASSSGGPPLHAGMAQGRRQINKRARQEEEP